MKTQPELQVGIMLAKELQFSLSDGYLSNSNINFGEGEYKAGIEKNKICIENKKGKKYKDESFVLLPQNTNASFELFDVIIGIDFHWEQKENQRFKGALKLIVENNQIRAINVVWLEEYLKSVISSEMSSTASLALLKAHAVISRSWLLAQIEKTKSIQSRGGLYQTSFETGDEIVRWYDREDHQNFDVCADDHCQRYQGISKIYSENAVKAVEETLGEVLFFENSICDARFSKCCGGVSENFENVWESKRFRYLTKVLDSEIGDTTCVDLRQEDEAELWIRNHPHAFCKTEDKDILSQVLPGFDQKIVDFYRWKLEYTQKEISAILKKRSGMDFGEIVKLEALKRGHSSRIIKLKITGTKKTVTVGKELEIRKWLSNSHLYSSAFVVDHLDFIHGIPQKFVFSGAGWGHGVGLCQIGAAVMGEKGYSFKQILNHYFRGAEILKLYKK